MVPHIISVLVFLSILSGCDKNAQKISKRGDLGNIDISTMKQNHILVTPETQKTAHLDSVNMTIQNNTFDNKTVVVKAEKLESLTGVKITAKEPGGTSYISAIKNIEICFKNPLDSGYTHVKIKSLLDDTESSILGTSRENKICIETRISSGLFELFHDINTQEKIESNPITNDKTVSTDTEKVKNQEQLVIKTLSGMSLLIQGGDYTTKSQVNLTISAINAEQMYVTNIPDCSSGGSWESYASTKTSWNLEQNNSLASVYVKFKNSDNNESNCISDSITHDNEAPSSLGLTIGEGNTTSLSSLNLAISATGASEMYVTNTLGCTSGGSWESYASTKNSWDLGQNNALATVYVKFKDLAGNESNCISDNITHDNIAPGTPSSFNSEAESLSLSVSSILSWNTSIDEGSGLSFYEVSIGNSAGDSSISEWSNVGSVLTTTVSGLNLTEGATYYANLRSTDHASNTSEILSVSFLGEKKVEDLSSGHWHACASFEDFSLKCWGNNVLGALGQDHSNNIGDTPSEMGSNLSNINLGTGRNVLKIAAGGFHTCALLDDNSVKCWGENASGQAGQGTTGSIGNETGEMGNLTAIDLGTERTAQDIVAGRYHNCAHLDDDTVKCWGENGEGQLGLGDIAYRGDAGSEMGDNLTTVDLGTARKAHTLVAGYYYNCVILDNSDVKCWGQNDEGQLGLGHSDNQGDQGSEMGNNLASLDLGTNRTAIHLSAGEDHSCAILDNGDLKCWGENSYGQLGYGDLARRGNDPSEMGDFLLPIDLGANRTATQVEAGYNFTCALLDNKTVKCWGKNLEGQLGQGNTTSLGDNSNEMGDNLEIVNLGQQRTAVKISVGEAYVCAKLDTNQIKCWGDGSDGQLGQGDNINLGDEGSEMGDNLPIIDL